MAVFDTIVIQHKHIIAFKCCLFTLKCEYEYRSLHRQNTPIYFSCAVDCLCDLPCLSAQTTLPSGRHPMFLRYSGPQQPVTSLCNVEEVQDKGMLIRFHLAARTAGTWPDAQTGYSTSCLMHGGSEKHSWYTAMQKAHCFLR